jgi:hypothetical protein
MMRRPALSVLLTLGGLLWAAAHWATHKAVAADSPTRVHHSHDPSHATAIGGGYLTTSLTLCLALALVLAAVAALETRCVTRGRSLWLFGVVPVLGLLVEVLAAFPKTPAGIASGLAELAPLLLVSLIVQVSVALVAVRLAHGILDLGEAVARAFVGPRRATDDRQARYLHLERCDRAPASRLSYAGSQRAPPALQPAF